MAAIVATTATLPTRTLAIDDLGGTVYIGIARVAASGAQAVWQIRKIVTIGAETRFYFADGDDRYNNVWDNRASLSYS